MIPFKKGDKVRMTSDYDLTKYRLYVPRSPSNVLTHRSRPDSKDHNMEKEGMAMANFIWAKAPPKGFSK
jgi:hypothetical protein